MKFSIIIPTCNSEKKIVETLDAIYLQNDKDYEVIIQDACSTDETIFKIENHILYNSKIKIYIEKDTGIYDAMNRAVKKAKGDYCIFLGAGDRFFDENVLSQIADNIRDELDIIYGYDYELTNNQCKELKRKINLLYKIKFTPVCHQAVFAKTSLLFDEPFDIRYKVAADQCWMLKMIKLQKKIQYVDIPIAYYPRDGFSSNHNEQFEKEQKMIHSTYYPFWEYFRSVWKKIKSKK